MQPITRTLSAIAFTATLFASGAALATPSANLAYQAYRGELPGIPGYQRLELGLNSRSITVDDIIEASGQSSSPQLRQQLRSSLRVITDFH